MAAKLIALAALSQAHAAENWSLPVIRVKDIAPEAGKVRGFVEVPANLLERFGENAHYDMYDLPTLKVFYSPEHQYSHLRGVIHGDSWSRQRENRRTCGKMAPGFEVPQGRRLAKAGSMLGEPKVVNGDESQSCIPWQVSIQRKEFSDHFCGGTLIDHGHVLTAAHCYWGDDVPNSEIKVVLGGHGLSPPEGDYEYSVRVAYIHPSYDEHTMSHDAMLLGINPMGDYAPWNESNCRMFACLPKEGEDEHPPDHCMVSGWGTLSEGGDSPDIVHVGGVRPMDHEQCEIHSNFGYQLDESMMCAQGERPDNGAVIDTCQGDSGGPLTCHGNITGRAVLRGITSFGMGCAEEDFPGVYTEVSSVMPWIKHRTGLIGDGPPGSVTFEIEGMPLDQEGWDPKELQLVLEPQFGGEDELIARIVVDDWDAHATMTSTTMTTTTAPQKCLRVSRGAAEKLQAEPCPHQDMHP